VRAPGFNGQDPRWPYSQMAVLLSRPIRQAPGDRVVEDRHLCLSRTTGILPGYDYEVRQAGSVSAESGWKPNLQARLNALSIRA